MNRSVTVGDVKLSIPGRIMRGIRMLLQLPGHLLNLVAFRAQQIMLGSAFTKLVKPKQHKPSAFCNQDKDYKLTMWVLLTPSLASQEMICWRVIVCEHGFPHIEHAFCESWLTLTCRCGR